MPPVLPAAPPRPLPVSRAAESAPRPLQACAPPILETPPAPPLSPLPDPSPANHLPHTAPPSGLLSSDAPPASSPYRAAAVHLAHFPVCAGMNESPHPRSRDCQTMAPSCHMSHR